MSLHNNRIRKSRLQRGASRPVRALAVVVALFTLLPAAPLSAGELTGVRGAYGYDGDDYGTGSEDSFEEVVAAGLFNTVNGSHYPP